MLAHRASVRLWLSVSLTLLDSGERMSLVLPPLLHFTAGDQSKDIAVLQLQAPPAVLKNIKPVSLGQSSNLFGG